MAPPRRTPLPVPLSVVEGLGWPAPVGGMQAVTLAVLQQLEHSQWLPPAELRARQSRQLALLATHAAAQLPFYRERFQAARFEPADAGTDEGWAKLPILTRAEVQQAGEAIACRSIPPQHGEITTTRTSGSTARSLTVPRSALALFYWNVFSLREAMWHGFDFAGKCGAIRIDWNRPPDSTALHVRRHEDWGPPFTALYPTGPGVVLDIRHTSTAEQAAWLRDEAPSHLVGFAVSLKVLARHCRAHGIRIPSLRTVYSQGEVLGEDARAACREAWGVEVVDNYSAVEVGSIAFQCPEHPPHLHVQSENLRAEIVDDAGRPCRPGEVGRLVVTPLHNFAMPLFRYEIGDLVEAGDACPCGRSLPVIRRVLGRTRDMLKLRDGSVRYPWYGQSVFAGLPQVIQHQAAQVGPEAVEIRIVARAPLNARDEAIVMQAVREALREPFTVSLSYVADIPRAASGKFEEFRCEW